MDEAARLQHVKKIRFKGGHRSAVLIMVVLRFCHTIAARDG
jgi:hypothetical protein